MNNRNHDIIAGALMGLIATPFLGLMLALTAVGCTGCRNPQKVVSTTPVNWTTTTPQPVPDPLPNAPETLAEFTAWFAVHSKTCPICKTPGNGCPEALTRLKAIIDAPVEPTAAEGTAAASQPLSDTDISAEAGRAEQDDETPHTDDETPHTCRNPLCTCKDCKCDGEVCSCGLRYKAGAHHYRVVRGRVEALVYKCYGGACAQAWEDWYDIPRETRDAMRATEVKPAAAQQQQPACACQRPQGQVRGGRGFRRGGIF